MFHAVLVRVMLIGLAVPVCAAGQLARCRISGAGQRRPELVLAGCTALVSLLQADHTERRRKSRGDGQRQS